MDESLPQQLCKVCGEEKPATTDHFHQNKTGKFGLSNTCKACAIKRSRQWYEDNKERASERAKRKYRENPEPVRQRSLKWQQDNHDQYLARLKKWADENREYKQSKDREYYMENSEQVRLRSKEWYQDNPSQARASRKAYYETHKETHHQQAAQWAKDHPEYRKAADARYRARKLAADGKYTVENILALYGDQCGLCGYCGLRLFGKYDVDHYVPLTRKGSNYPENLILACASCNRSKGDKTFEEWAAIRGW